MVQIKIVIFSFSLLCLSEFSFKHICRIFTSKQFIIADTIGHLLLLMFDHRCYKNKM